MSLLHQVFSRFRDHGLVVKESKCIMAVNKLSFLGYQVSSAGLAPLPDKVEAIRNFTLPRTKRQLKRYLGMYQFYSRFVKNHSRWLQPLHSLASGGSPRRPITWNGDLVKCFEESKVALANATLLAFLDPDAETQLVTDASGNSIGCVLQTSQKWRDYTSGFLVQRSDIWTIELVCFRKRTVWVLRLPEAFPLLPGSKRLCAAHGSSSYSNQVSQQYSCSFSSTRTFFRFHWPNDKSSGAC